MVFSVRSTVRLSTLRPTTPRLTSTRPFTSAPQRRIKEDSHRSPEQLEQAKQEQLKKQEQGKGEWHEGLASNGEADVAADRQAEGVQDHGEHMEELQRETAGEKEREHPEGKA